MNITPSQAPELSRPAPKYARVMDDIARRIARNEWPTDTALPTVAQMEKAYGCHRHTVLRALKELQAQGYLSVEQGRGTFVRRQRVAPYVGMLFGDDILNPQSTPFCSLLAKAAQDFFHGQRCELKYYIEHPHLLDEGVLDRDLVEDSQRGRLHGLITAGSNLPQAMTPRMTQQLALRPQLLPWVDISVFDTAAHRVTADRVELMTIGLDFIREQGRHRVAAIGLGNDIATDDLTPFHELVQQRGLTTRPEWISRRKKFAEQDGYEGMQAIWQAADKPDALLVMDDISARGAVQAMLGLGIRVPEDLLVISHANKGSGIFYPLAFPKIEYDPVEFMTRAGEMMIELMDNPGLPPKTVSIHPQLVLPAA